MIDVQQNESELSEKQVLYNALDTRLKNSTFDGSAAQAHGIACGLACRDVKSTELDAKIEYLSFTDEHSVEALESLIEMNQRDLNQADFQFDLWLPDVDELALQLEALAEWSQGYIIGLMYDGKEVLAQLNSELQASVQDIIEIAGLESTTSDSNEDQVAFIELREYLRAATQLIYEELNPDQPIESVHE
jgi:uncharacterized protein YgfB (UPF0149 family)